VDAAASGRVVVFAGRALVRERTQRADDRRGCVRQNCVVLAPVAGVKSAEAKSTQPSLISLNPSATVTRRIRRRGEHGISRKAIVRGTPECSDCTCMLVCVFLCTYCTRDRGCSKHPAFPAPSLEEEPSQNSGASRPRGENAYEIGSAIPGTWGPGLYSTFV
jgi:hypothetical protein